MPKTTGKLETASDEQLKFGINESVESYKAVASRSSGRFRDLSNLYPGMSARPEFTLDDYNAFRPANRGPQSYCELFNTCNAVYENVGLIWNIINLMTDFTVKGVRLVHKNKRQEGVFQDWFQRIKGLHVSERFVNYLYRLGNVVAQRYTAIATEDEIAVAHQMPDKKLPKMFIPKKNEIPWKYVFINPAICEMIGGPLSAFVTKPIYGIKLSEELKNIIKAPKTEYDRQIVAQLPANIVEAAKANKPYPLDPDDTIVYHFKKDDWNSWALPIIAPILDNIKTLDKLMFADQCVLDGAASKVRVFGIGNMEYKIPPSPAMAQKLSELLESNVGGGTIDIVWGPDLKIQETTNDMWDLLGPEKYKPTMDAIYSSLGVPQTLTASVAGQGGATNNFMSLKTLTERLSYGRSLLVDFWEREIAIFQKAMGYRSPAEVEFDQPILANEDTEKQLLIQLCDRNLISEELLQIRFGMKPNMEKVRLNREKRERDSGTRVRKAGQWMAGEPELELKKIALQSGQISPGQAGLELDAVKDDEVKQMKKLPLMKKAAEPSKAPGQSGQGRPKTKKDSKKRKTKKFSPSKGTVALWANAAQAKIAEIINPTILTKFSKANFRQLTSEEFNEAENIKFHVLCGLTPLEEVDEDRVLSELKLSKNHTDKIEVVNSKINEFKELINREPTVDEVRLIQSEVYSDIVDSINEQTEN